MASCVWNDPSLQSLLGESMHNPICLRSPMGELFTSVHLSLNPRFPKLLDPKCTFDELPLACPVRKPVLGETHPTGCQRFLGALLDMPRVPLRPQR